MKFNSISEGGKGAPTIYYIKIFGPGRVFSLSKMIIANNEV
jgi:hypothetical protein